MELANLSLFDWIINLFILFITFVVFLAAIGKTIGVRTTYIKVLQFLFQWGSKTIERHNSRDGKAVVEDDGTEPEYYDYAPSDEMLELEEGFDLSDVMYFTTEGMQTIVDDEVTKSFDAAELPSWNFLTRNKQQFQLISIRLTLAWLMGCFLRYFILFPFRVILACLAIGLMFFGTLIIGYMPDGRLKKLCHRHVSQTAYRIMTRAMSAVVKFHNQENKTHGGGICVANHTTPFDIIILGGDNCYSMVGQMQKGFFGIMQRAFSRAETHIWFERSAAKDRGTVTMRLKEHGSDKTKLPILIFPEGMCVSNEHVLQFKKGSFEVGVDMYPIAMKYNPLFADPFWGDNQDMVLHHLFLIMTSWALVVDIWYLPPTSIQPGETPIQFANRVKGQIAKQTGMKDLDWDASLKYSRPKPELLKRQQEMYTHIKKLKPEQWTSDG